MPYNRGMADSSRPYYNPEMITALATAFPRDRDPSFQWPRVPGILQSIPSLRAAWFGGRDISGNGQTLTFGGNTVMDRHGLAPLVTFPGASGDSLSRADNAILDILGTETDVAAALRGLSMGCWVRIDALGTGDNYILAKWESATATTGSYRVFHNGSTISFSVTNGTTNYTASLASALVVGEWACVTGRFDPSTNVFLNVNAVAGTPAGSAPASLNDSTVDFRIGGRTSAADEINGAVAFPWLAAAFLPEFYHNAFFQHTRSLFGA